ncbi:hypothetical protein STEG23_008200, partial [Scotinomys teguina]
MSQRPAPPLYFPSLYDQGISSSPLGDFNIWKKLFVPLKAGGAPAGGVAAVAGVRPLPLAAPVTMPPPPPGLGPPSEHPCPPPWPSGLASIPYEPLRFFYSPPPGPEMATSALVLGSTTPWLASASYPEELCELEIRIKELELLTITGDGFDSQRCSPAVGLVSVCSNKFRSSVEFPIMILITLASIIPLPSLQLDFYSLAWCLDVGPCICFHQLLDEGSMMTVRVLTSLNTGEGQF